MASNYTSKCIEHSQANKICKKFAGYGEPKPISLTCGSGFKSYIVFFQVTMAQLEEIKDEIKGSH